MIFLLTGVLSIIPRPHPFRKPLRGNCSPHPGTIVKAVRLCAFVWLVLILLIGRLFYLYYQITKLRAVPFLIDILKICFIIMSPLK